MQPLSTVKQPTGKTPSMRRLALASLVGTAIEFYDFFVYGTAAALVLGPLFFPAFSQLAGTLAAFGTLGVGFVARPLGAMLFGHLGDRHGRRPVLVVSLLLTGGATVAVGCLPPYASLGVAAPVLLVALRFLQGLGLGGEWGGAVLLATEHAPAARRGLWASFPPVGSAVGFVVANGLMTALTALLTKDQFGSWGWRVPFWTAGVFTLVGLWLRASLEESPRFLEIDDHARVPLVELLRRHWRPVLLAAGGVACVYAVHFTATTWSLAYATERLGVDRTVTLVCLTAAVVVVGALTPLAAHLGDRFGRRPMCLAGCAWAAVWMAPMLALLTTREPLLMFLGVLGALLSCGTVVAVVSAYLPELFEARVRCTGASVGYNLGGVLGGALTPLVATALAGGGGRVPWGVAGYLSVLALLSMACFAMLPETRPVPAAVPELSGTTG